MDNSDDSSKGVVQTLSKETAEEVMTWLEQQTDTELLQLLELTSV
jgi:hypothetical protein